MKRVRINAGKVGLVFKNGDYVKVITNGIHWLGFNTRVLMYDLATTFNTPVALELLLEDKTLEAMLDVIEVKDSELVLVYEKGVFKTILTAGRYVYWKGLIEREFVRADLSKIYITEKIDK